LGQLTLILLNYLKITLSTQIDSTPSKNTMQHRNSSSHNIDAYGKVSILSDNQEYEWIITEHNSSAGFSLPMFHSCSRTLQLPDNACIIPCNGLGLSEDNCLLYAGIQRLWSQHCNKMSGWRTLICA